MPILSNNVKVALFCCDITERTVLDREHSITVQKYSYTVVRDVDSDRLAHGQGMSKSFNVQIRVGSRDNLKDLYEDIKNSYPRHFSLVFNAEYDENNTLASYSGGIVFNGFVVSMDEKYDRDEGNIEGQQMYLSLGFLVKSIAYLKEDSDPFVHVF